MNKAIFLGIAIFSLLGIVTTTNLDAFAESNSKSRLLTTFICNNDGCVVYVDKNGDNKCDNNEFLKFLDYRVFNNLVDKGIITSCNA